MSNLEKFEFKNNNLELDIAGNKFQVNSTDTDLVKRVLDFGEATQVKAKELVGKDNYLEALEEAIQFCIEAIDSILGKGAAEKIFKGREVGLFDCLDVINYVTNAIKEDRDTKFQSYSPNRAARRK